MDTLKQLPLGKTKPAAPPPVIGDTRRVGLYGPIYKVAEILSPDLIKIMVLESGEVSEYDVSTYRNDPQA